MELFYPEMRVELGSYIFTEGIEITVHSAASTYFDWAKVRFTRQFQEKITIPQDTWAAIYLGYDGTFFSVFEGYVVREYNNAEADDEILLKDAAILLEKTQIASTFLSATPQEIITYCLEQAGITDYSLSDVIHPRRARFPIMKKNILSVIGEVHSAWQINVPFFFLDSVFYWGDAPKQQVYSHFEYQQNIIRLDREDGAWALETVSVPFIRHSQVISLTHPRLSGEFTVKKVIFTTESTGFIRTKLVF
ncbi:serine/arginine repetitive matrix protein 2 [Oscillospiraceae bacterium OttesenSCG-928-F05]|nr:serine/arginine repetitive matrix protein 2 [Oscillospiraceae bacterium OttesenSCG-928-F05]